MGPWTNTDNCTENCGDEGVKIKTRTCTPVDPSFNCSTLETQKEGSTPCNRRDCLELGNWTDIGSCSKKCGDGTFIQERTCTAHDGSVSCDDQQLSRNGSTPCIRKACSDPGDIIPKGRVHKKNPPFYPPLVDKGFTPLLSPS